MKSQLNRLPKELLIEIVEKQNLPIYLNYQECKEQKKKLDERIYEFIQILKKKIEEKIIGMEGLIPQSFISNHHSVFTFHSIHINVKRKEIILLYVDSFSVTGEIKFEFHNKELYLKILGRYIHDVTYPCFDGLYNYFNSSEFRDEFFQFE
jgi:hypothetical protein